jgi:ABC-type amino acid transport substrate-binding protein
MSGELASALDQILARGAVRLAVEFKDPIATGFPPEMFLDPETGQPAGVGPVLAGIMADDLGVGLECVDLPWPDHIDTLLRGDVDLILGTNTPARALRVDFLPGRLMENRVTCLARRAAADRDRGAFDAPGVTIACWYGSTTVQVAREHFPRAQVREAADPQGMVLAGEADAYVTDSVTFRLLELFPDLDFVRDGGDGGDPIVLSREHVHFGLPRGDRTFMTWLVNWYDYHDAQGTVARWCVDYWEASMADYHPPGGMS